MLPQFELQALFNAMNFSMNPDPDYTSTTAVVNMTAAVTVLNTLLCPSDGGPSSVQVGGGIYAGHNYLLNVGSHYAVVQNPPSPALQPNGILYENSAVTIAAIRDGTSLTAVLSESIRSSAGAPTGFNGLTNFAQDPLSGFVITGTNVAGDGPPITSDADYV